MITVSLCMLTKDENEALARTLQNCGHLFDEIVVVDLDAAGSAAQAAGYYTDQLLRYDWKNDFSKARNFAFSAASGEYIMWLDPGDTVLASDQRQLCRLKEILPHNVDAVMMPYCTAFDAGGRVTEWQYRERLLRRGADLHWVDPAHAYIPVSGPVKEADIHILRGERPEANRNLYLDIYNTMVVENTPFSARSLLYYARELRERGLCAEAAAQYDRFLVSAEAAPVDKMNACFEASRCCLDTGNEKTGMEMLLKSLQYAAPTPEICCGIGDILYGNHRYADAAFWYKLALETGTSGSAGIHYEDFSGYVPALQLCMCSYNLGDVEKAFEYNALAGRIKPDDPSVVHNRKFFASLRR